MSSSNVTVKGLKELGQALQEIPEKLRKNVMRSALRAGANVLKAEVLMRVPVGPPSEKGRRLYGGYIGALRDSVKVSTRFSRGVVTAKVSVGGSTKKGANVFYAHFLEFGTAAHQINAKRGHTLAFGGGYHRSVMHPGIKPQPFIRPALDGQAMAAVHAVAEKIREVLASKHGIDVPQPLEEGDE